MNNLPAVIFTVEVLEKTFLILLALAIGESFKQFVREPNSSADIHIHWWRLPSLIVFLLLITPFSHGMVIYLHDAYCNSPVPNYAVYLLEDVVAFTIEAALFFVLSRGLDLSSLTLFYSTVLILLIVDSGWGELVSFHRPDISNWLRLNEGAGVAFFLLLLARIFWLNGVKGSKFVAVFGIALMLIRTILDYNLNWEFYFPPTSF